MENTTKVKPNKTINSLFRTFFKSLVTQQFAIKTHFVCKSILVIIVINRNTAISKEVLRTGFCIHNRLLQDIHQILVIDIVQKIQLFEISGSVFHSFGFLVTVVELLMTLQ